MFSDPVGAGVEMGAVDGLIGPGSIRLPGRGRKLVFSNDFIWGAYFAIFFARIASFI